MEQMQLVSGGGSSMASVNTRNQILTRSIMIPAIHEASLLGKAYSWTAISADIVAGETALLVSNTSNLENLVISRAYLWADTACQIKVHCPAAAVFTGTEVVGNNLNRNFANNAPAVAFADETANAFVAGNVIETVYSYLAVNAQVTTSVGIPIDFKDAVILGENNAIAVDTITENAAFEVTIVGYFIPK